MAEPEGWVRLHPLSPLLNAGRYALLAVLFTFQAWADQLFDAAPGATLILRIGGALVVVGLVAFAYSMIAWRFAMYRMTDEIVEYKTGILFRSYRHLPFERIESVDTAQPLVPRLLGLAEVRVEAISKKGTELRLRYLSLDDAERLRLELSARRRSDATQGHPPETAVSPMLQVPARELALGYVLLPAGLAAAVAIPTVAVVGLVAGWQRALVVVLIGAVSGLGYILPAVLRLERLWGFRLDDADRALVINRGLLNLNTQRILVGRVQALRVDQPLLWRPLKRYRVLVDVAGYRGASDEAAAAAATLLPIAPYEVVRYLVYRLDMRVDLAALPLEPVPRRSRWRSLRWRGFRAAWTDSHAVVQSGVLWRRTAVVPLQRVQSARVTQGPWQRRLRLATVRLDTAGSRIKVAAAHRDAREAVGVAQASARRALSCIDTPQPPCRCTTVGVRQVAHGATCSFQVVVGTGVDPVTFRFSDEPTRCREQVRFASAQVGSDFCCPPVTAQTRVTPLSVARMLHGPGSHGRACAGRYVRPDARVRGRARASSHRSAGDVPAAISLVGPRQYECPPCEYTNEGDERSRKSRVGPVQRVVEEPQRSERGGDGQPG